MVLAHGATGKAIDKLASKAAEFEDRLTSTQETKFSLEEGRRLIGRRVRILNPSKNEPYIGTIAAVGKIYVTVELPGGTQRKRFTKNLRLMQHE